MEQMLWFLAGGVVAVILDRLILAPRFRISLELDDE
jgi:hypothetical protein